MTIDQIIQDKKALDEILRNALSSMEKKDTIKETRARLFELQASCPHHSDKYNWEPINKICPYCGKKLE